MLQKVERDILANWMDGETFEIVSAFPRKGGMYHAFNETRPSYDWGLFQLYGDKWLCSEYDICVVPSHKCLFSFMGFLLPFKNF